MDRMPLISIIVPVYNVEKYLDRCVQSIVDQTYRHLEIILVDDGSPDNCPAMCDAWAAKDSRIRVIHKENGGLSHARNAGMTLAAGEYLGFVDSDDWIHPDMYRLLHESITEHDSDIAACGVEMVWEDHTPSRMLTRAGACVLDTREAMAAIIEETWLKQPVWYKLYKTHLVRDIPFPVGKCHEDVFWSYQAVGRAQRISVFDTPCYCYFQRSGSIMGADYSLKRLDALEAKHLRLEYIQENLPLLENIARKNLIFSCIYTMQMSLLYLTGAEFVTAKSQITAVWQENRSPMRLSLKELVWLCLGSISLEGACKLRNLLKIGF